MIARKRLQLIRIFSAILAFLTITASSAICIAKENANKPMTLAVFDFEIPSKTLKTEISSGHGNRLSISESLRTNVLTDKFITSLVKSGRVNVVERSRLEALLKESDLGRLGMTDPKATIAAGRLAGAQYLLFGMLEHFDSAVKDKPVPYTSRVIRTGQINIGATIRVVDTETGRVVAAHSGSISHIVKNLEGPLEGQHIQKAEEELAMKLTYLVLDEIFPIKVMLYKGSQIYLNQGQNNGIIAGMRFLIVRHGAELKDPDTGVSLGFEQMPVAMIRIVSVEAKTGIAEVLDWKMTEHEVRKGDVCKRQSDDQPGTDIFRNK